MLRRKLDCPWSRLAGLVAYGSPEAPDGVPPGIPCGERTLRSRYSALPASALLLGLLLSLPGCVGWHELKAEHKKEDRPIRTLKTREVIDGWRYAATVTVDRRSDGQPERVRLEASRFKDCAQTVHRMVDRTEIKHIEVPTGLRIGGYALSGLGASLLSGGIALKADGSGDRELTTAMVALGALLSSNLILMVIHELRAIDSSKHIGVVEERTSVADPKCHVEPAAGAEVRITSTRGEALREGKTDENGRFEAPVDLGQVLKLGSVYVVTVGGTHVQSVQLEVSSAFAKP